MPHPAAPVPPGDHLNYHPFDRPPPMLTHGGTAHNRDGLDDFWSYLMNANSVFTGKGAFASGTAYWTLNEESSIVLAPAAQNPPSNTQRFNLYTLDTVTLQAPDGGYLVFDAARQGYVSRINTMNTADNPAQFVLNHHANNGVSLQEIDQGVTYNVVVTNGLLTRTTDPSNNEFIYTAISPGLNQILAQKVAHDTDLTWVDFHGADLSRIDFSSSTLSYANFVGCTLFSTRFNGSILKGAVFNGCTLEAVALNDVSANQAQFVNTKILKSSFLNMMNAEAADFTNAVFDPGTVLNAFSAPNAKLSDAQMSKVVMNVCNLEGAYMVGVNLQEAMLANAQLSRAVMLRTNCRGTNFQTSVFDQAQLATSDFSKAILTNSRFKNANLTNAQLRNAQSLYGVDFSGASLVGVDLHEVDFVELKIRIDENTNFTRATLDKCNLQGYTLDNMTFLYASMRSTKLDRTSIVNTSLVGADLSYASVTGGVNMVGSNLSNSRLEGATFTGVQMGPLKPVAELPTQLVSTLDQGVFHPASLLENTELLKSTAWQENAAALRPLLQQPSAAVDVRLPGEHWRIEADGHTFLLKRHANAIAVSQVESDVTGAILSNAFMPNANFSEANLYAVDLSGVNWYGASASAKAANLEQANLTRANVATMDFTQADMFGVNLSFANAIGANFTGVKLMPTSQLKPVSLAFTSLQSTIFTDSVLNAANMTNAAVCMSIHQSAIKTQGTYVFSLPEDYTTDLNSCFVTDRLIKAFDAHHIKLSTYSPLVLLQLNNLWLCRTNLTQNDNYLLTKNPKDGAILVYHQETPGATQIDLPPFHAVPLASLPVTLIPDLNTGNLSAAVRTALTNAGYALDKTAVMAVVQQDQFWAIRNIDNAPYTQQVGYGQFYLLPTLDLGEPTLTLYGASPLLVLRISAGNEIQRVLSMFGPTLFDTNSLTDSTTTPSGLKYELMSANLSYEYLMTAGLPPKPPMCIPSPTTWCNN